MHRRFGTQLRAPSQHGCGGGSHPLPVSRQLMGQGRAGAGAWPAAPGSSPGGRYVCWPSPDRCRIFSWNSSDSGLNFCTGGGNCAMQVGWVHQRHVSLEADQLVATTTARAAPRNVLLPAALCEPEVCELHGCVGHRIITPLVHAPAPSYCPCQPAARGSTHLPLPAPPPYTTSCPREPAPEPDCKRQPVSPCSPRMSESRP